MSYVLSVEPPVSASIEGLPTVSFSIDLTDWWTIPGLELCGSAADLSNGPHKPNRVINPKRAVAASA